MTVEIPDYVQAEGNVKAFFVPTVASFTSPDASSIEAAGVDISCFLMPDWDGPTAAQNTGEQRRFCSKQTFDVLGRVKWTLSPLMYTYLPQALGTPGDPANAMYEALAPGNEGVVIIGYGLNPADAFAAGDVVDLFPVECGAQMKPARGADEFAPLTVTQTLAVNGIAVFDSVMVV